MIVTHFTLTMQFLSPSKSKLYIGMSIISFVNNSSFAVLIYVGMMEMEAALLELLVCYSSGNQM